MWRIPVGTQIPVEVHSIDQAKTRLQVRSGGLATAVPTVLPDLGNDQGRAWRLHALNLYISTCGAGGQWVDLNLYHDPSGQRVMWVRFPITALYNARIFGLRNGPNTRMADTITPSETWYCPLPDIWLDDDYYWTVYPQATDGTFSFIYEEIRV